MLKKILIVDDEEDIVLLLGIRLKSYGYTVISATDVDSAITEAKTNNPDLIIMDIKMPGGGGYAVCENLKACKDTENIPIYLTSALPPNEVEDKVSELGVSGFISKPFETDRVLEIIKNVIG